MSTRAVRVDDEPVYHGIKGAIGYIVDDDGQGDKVDVVFPVIGTYRLERKNLTDMEFDQSQHKYIEKERT